MNPSSKFARFVFPGGVLFVMAAVAATGLVSMAIAKTFSLTIAKSAKVSNTSGTTAQEPIVVSSRLPARHDRNYDDLS